MQRCDYLLLTALDDERDALVWALEKAGARNRQRTRAPNAPVFFVWTLDHDLGALSIATASLWDPGNEATSEYLQPLLSALQPSYVGLIGIAGAAQSDIKPGSILLANRVWHYEPAKVRAGSTEHRGQTHVAGRLLLDRVRHADLKRADALFPELAPWPEPMVGTFGSGEKVIAAANARDELRDASRNVIGFETEGHSFATVAERMLGPERWFIIRSVQDTADESKSDEHRLLACRRAAAFAVTFILDFDLCIPVSSTNARAVETSAGSAPEPAPGNTETSAPRGKEEGLSDFTLRVAKRLVVADPAALLDEIAAHHSGTPHLDSVLLEAEAAWRLQDPIRCRSATVQLSDQFIANDTLLTTSTATLLRLHFWSLWKTAGAQQPRTLIERNLHRVTDPVERGRWADLAATIRRHDEADDWLPAVAMYQQALALKQSTEDRLGVAITLQNIGFTYVEWLDLSHARYYFKKLKEHAAASAYDGSRASECLAHLALAWVDLMAGGPAELTASRMHLQLAGQVLQDPGGVPTELRRAAKVLALFQKARQGRRLTLPKPPNRVFWARLILAQVAALRGAERDELAAEVLRGEAEPLLARHRIRPLIDVVIAPQEPVQPASTPVPWEHQEPGPWPLSVWLAADLSDSFPAMQFLEGVAQMYAALLDGVATNIPVATNKPDPGRRSLGAGARYISEWVLRNQEHPLSAEAMVIGSILRDAVPARNVVAHSTPGQDLSAARLSLTRIAKRLSEEIRLLRSAEWVSRVPPTLRVGGIHVDMTRSFKSDDSGRLRMEINGQVLAREESGTNDPGGI